ncbi:diphthine methyl ester synthase [Pancytospora philotis]|nr:diphthine methyl ester synthase [Pancytospora philotis]
MLYVIGIGLNDCRDISLRSLDILRKTEHIFQECYTCIQAVDFAEIEALIGKRITMADRKMVEEMGNIVELARTADVAFLVAGTPLFATTHADLLLRAKEAGVETRVIHNTSILNVKGCYGLYSYSFGRTVSIPYFTETWRPMSFYDYIRTNWTNGLHTLCLLDIKTDEGRFMTANEAIEQLLECEREHGYGCVTPTTKLFAVCRFATDSEHVAYDTAEALAHMDHGAPLHSLIVPAALSCIEEEFVGELFGKK